METAVDVVVADDYDDDEGAISLSSSSMTNNPKETDAILTNNDVQIRQNGIAEKSKEARGAVNDVALVLKDNPFACVMADGHKLLQIALVFVPVGFQLTD